MRCYVLLCIALCIALFLVLWTFQFFPRWGLQCLSIWICGTLRARPLVSLMSPPYLRGTARGTEVSPQISLTLCEAESLCASAFWLLLVFFLCHPLLPLAIPCLRIPSYSLVLFGVSFLSSVPSVPSDSLGFPRFPCPTVGSSCTCPVLWAAHCGCLRLVAAACLPTWLTDCVCVCLCVSMCLLSAWLLV